MRKVTIFCLLLGSYVSVAQSGKVEPFALPSNAGLSENLRSALETSGYHLAQSNGDGLCDIWLRKNVPTQAKKDVADALYPELPESTLIGLISFPKAGSDYRGQAIPAGFYTMRYELLPDDGNHLGVAPNRDFVLLVPVKNDPDPNANFKFEQLVSLSRKATGTRHPGPLSFVQPGSATGLSKDEEDHWIFTTSLKLQSGNDLPIGLVVKGTAPQ
jgi:hypothetical protein